jgi:hypothetical protein
MATWPLSPRPGQPALVDLTIYWVDPNVSDGQSEYKRVLVRVDGGALVVTEPATASRKRTAHIHPLHMIHEVVVTEAE